MDTQRSLPAASDKPPSPKVQAQHAALVIQNLSGVPGHDVALTLGSGWSKAADLIGETIAEIPAEEVPGFSTSGIPGHTGMLRSIRLPNGKHALVLGARTHLYEDKGVRAVVHSVRTAAACGTKVMVLTNGACAIKESWSPGTPMLISDRLNHAAFYRSPRFRFGLSSKPGVHGAIDIECETAIVAGPPQFVKIAVLPQSEIQTIGTPGFLHHTEVVTRH